MSSSSLQKFVAMAVIFQMSALPAVAAELEYPELTMTPKYTERLEMESKDEGMRSWTMHIPIQLAAVTNITAGLVMATDTANQTAGLSAYPLWLIPTAIGGAWLGLTVGLAAGYRPYAKAVESTNAMPNKTKRDSLLRERMAEEEIEFMSSTGWRLAILSITTQSIAGLSLLALNRPTAPAAFIGLGATLLSFAPLIFQYRWGHVACEQRDYKKRIYAPIASAGFLPEPTANGGFSVAPAMTLSFSF